MSNTYTTSALRMNNQKAVLRHIYRHREATPLQLQQELSLSRPTVAQILKDLQGEELVCTKGLADSTGGRKANLYTFCAQARIAVGVEIFIDRFELTAVDLYGEMLQFERHSVPFSNSEGYFDEICRLICAFICRLQVPAQQILGVGIALQALISGDGKRIVYGRILDCEGLRIDAFSRRIPHPCSFSHDAEAAVNVELWHDPQLQNAVFLNIRSDVSGSTVINRQFFQAGAYKSGLFEHMTIVPDGKPCYCGKRGCVNTCCSTSALLHPAEELSDFFSRLRRGDGACRERWHSYLDDLALAIDNLHMVINSDIILGGTLARHLLREDIDYLHRSIQNKTAFPTAEQYIRVSAHTQLPACIGAALPFVTEYLDSILT